ncbi:uncharacterized protein LOC133866679 [Alnus glutinosa]|uniref:uncharacterized protein LOC133866679 n=1 Tax=Alnus glutinosa TaxID=3517 RepID=UPI002D7A1644|nr:uncharacterized protein LOC133866679 [Alnus glutinosa]
MVSPRSSSSLSPSPLWPSSSNGVVGASPTPPPAGTQHLFPGKWHGWNGPLPSSPTAHHHSSPSDGVNFGRESSPSFPYYQGWKLDYGSNLRLKVLLSPPIVVCSPSILLYVYDAHAECGKNVRIGGCCQFENISTICWCCCISNYSCCGLWICCLSSMPDSLENGALQNHFKGIANDVRGRAQCYKQDWVGGPHSRIGALFSC